MTLSADDLLLGGSATYRVSVPAEVLAPGGRGSDATAAEAGDQTVVLRPLVLADIQRIARAARDDQTLTSVLMVQQSLVDPPVTIDQVQHMHAGLVEHLLREVNRVSGLSLTGDELTDAVQAPMARACFELSRQFGWTPEECAALTVGQVLLYLELLGRGEAVAGP